MYGNPCIENGLFFYFQGFLYAHDLSEGGHALSASNSPVPYTGNKSCIIDTLLGVMPRHSVYVEACMGSAEMFLSKPPAEKEILNDYNGDLVNFFRVLQNNEKLAYLIGRLYLSVNAELLFKYNRELLQEVPNILDDMKGTAQIVAEASWDEIQQAAAFFENQVYSFSSTGMSFGIMKRDMTKRFARLVSACCRLRNAIILHRDYKDAIRYAAAPGTFILLDPPYKETEGSYVKSNFDPSQHEVLFNFMAGIDNEYKGECKFLITYNNHPYIKSLAEKHGFVTHVEERLHAMRQAR